MSGVKLIFTVLLHHHYHHLLQCLPHRNEEAQDCRNSSLLVGNCQDKISGSVCHPDTGSCECSDSLPFKLEGSNICVKAVPLDSPCKNDEECHHLDKNSICLQVTSTSSYCRCKRNYEKLVLSKRSQCIAKRPSSGSENSVPTVAALGIGLSVLTALLCFTLKLFSKAQTVRTRGYGDASLPPTITVEGKDFSEEECNWSRASSKSRIYTPGPPLTPTQVRRMSTLSTMSVTVQDKDFTVRPVSPRNTANGSNDPLFGKEEPDVEQHLTIIPRLGINSRRKSMANYAFPELHSKTRAGGNDTNNILILTRTKTDPNGRRHSVAIPLLAPPEGAKVDTGVQIERKITAPQQPSVLGKGVRRHSIQMGHSQPTRTASTRGPTKHSRRQSKQSLYQFLDRAIAN